MGYSDQFFTAIGLNSNSSEELKNFSKNSGVSLAWLKYYNTNNIIPSGNNLEHILSTANVSERYLRLKMGKFDAEIVEAIQKYTDDILPILNRFQSKTKPSVKSFSLEFETSLGQLYQGDCLDVISSIKNDSVDLIFADPPFNLSKLYPSKIDDNLKTEKYLHWCREWLNECVRVLKPGGALFVWNLPKWNVILSSHLESMLTFRNWIGVDIKYSMPIQNRLYPSHYSLIYYIKGEKPNTFHPDRLPMSVCPKCYGELKDYGGYKNKMNPLGINITDIWTDIPPVRHAKYKRRKGSNELSLKLLDRIIEMSTNEGDLVFDPFGGSGTTYRAAELKRRRWIGCEVGPIDVIKERFNVIREEKDILNGYRDNLNTLFTADVKSKREHRGIWTCESIHKKG